MKYILLLLASIMNFDVDQIVSNLNKVIVEQNYYQTIEKNDYLMHAGSGIDGHAYTNSIEAIQSSYDEGYRLFEVDVRITSDGFPVLVHDFLINDYKKRIQNDWYLTVSPNEEGLYVPDLETFMNFKIQKEYTATSFEMLVDFMKEHRDMYVLVDAGYADYEETYELYKGILRVCEDENVLNRLITGGHTKGSVEAQQSLYNFPLINMYIAEDEIREKEFGSMEDWLNYCNEVDANSYSIAYATHTKELAEYLSDKGLYSYIFTIDDEEVAKEHLNYGADVIGTNFLRE